MFCNRIFDFVTGTEIVLPLAGTAEPAWDIVRPNEAAEHLLANHMRTLAAQVSDSHPQDRADRPVQ